MEKNNNEEDIINETKQSENNNNDIILDKLPVWSIEPPIEIKRGEE